MTSQIRFESLGRTARWGLTVKGETPVGTPQLPLTFDERPLKEVPERVLLAGIVLTGPHTTFEFNQPISQSLKAGMESIGLKISSKVSTPRSEEAVQATLLQVTPGLEVSHKTPDRDQTRLFLPPSERFQGRLIGVKEMVIPSNAAWLAQRHGPKVLLASALLFSADLLSKGFIIDAIDRDENFSFYQEVLKLENLELHSQSAH